MADIIESDVKLYKSEDQTDTATGGGRISSNVVESGVVNNLFANISRVDRLQGRIQPKKVFQKIDSINTGVYSGAHIIVRDMPLDENVSVLMFDTDDHNDNLPDIVEYMENYYQASTPVGNAGLEYAVSEGDRQLVFKIRHYEYTPEYNRVGKLVYLKKIDVKYAFNATVGDLLLLDDGAGATEHIHIQEMERVTEHLDGADEKHYYTVEYIIVTLSAGLLNAWIEGVVPYRTLKNSAWKAYGAMMLADDAAEGDTVISLASTKSRIAPVISRTIAVADQAFFGPPTMAADASVGADGIEWTMEQAEEINTSEALPAVAGKASYTHVLANKPLKASSLEIWYRANLGWLVITETDGTLSGDGSGSVSEDGVVTFSLSEPADPETSIMLYYTRSHNLAGFENISLTSPDITYQQTQVAVASETETITGTIADAPVQAGYVRLFMDEGSGWEVFGTDGGAGVLTGDNINACEINYYTGEWSLTFQSFYTAGVVLKWEYVPLNTASNQETGYTGDYAGAKSGSIVIDLEKNKIGPGSLNLSLQARYFYTTTHSVLGYTYRRLGIQEIAVTDDGAGSLSGTGDGTATGEINYQTGLANVSFIFDSTIHERVSWQASYLHYVASAYAQSELPYVFSIGRTDALPGSLLVKYYTEDVDPPWYAREINGALELQASLDGWESGSTFSCSRDFRRVYFLNGRWLIAAAPYSGSYMMALFLSVDGRSWAVLTHDMPQATYLTHFAFDPARSLYVGVGDSYTSSYDNVGTSSALESWATQNIGDGVDFVGIAWSAEVGLFVAIAADSIWTTPDGTVWTEQVSEIASAMRVVTSVDFGSGEMFLIFSQDNKFQYSTDGINWTLGQSQIINPVVDAAILEIDGEVLLFAVDNLGSVSVTTDGAVFTALESSMNGTPTSMASDGAFNLVATLDDGTIDVSSNAGESWVNQEVDHQWSVLDFHQIAFAADAGWLHLTHGNDGDSDAMKPAVLPVNLMTDESGSVIKDVGTFDPSTGTGEITAGDLPFSAAARYFLTPRRLSSFVVFTWGAVPVHDNSFTVFGRTHTGAMLMLSEDSENPGMLAGDGTGTINKETGIAEMTFTFPVRPETIRISYNYGSIYKPEYDEINTRALPMDGLVPVVSAGDVAVVVEYARAKLTSAITDTDMAIDIDDGSVFPDRDITVKIEDEQITGAMSGNTFSVTARGANETIAAEHSANAVIELVTRREEMINILQVAGNRITTPTPLAYAYKAGGAILTSAIVKGDLYARESGRHTQAAEVPTQEWIDPDDYTGDPADGTYNFADYPLELTNQGATTERWKLTVTGTSPVIANVEGEYLGVIATDVAISSDISPANPQTGGQYFTLPFEGWGAGWQVGNILRFDTVMAGGPAWITRVINARASDIQDDYATLHSRGDVAV